MSGKAVFLGTISTMEDQHRILVLGLGNLLQGDEGFGVQALALLKDVQTWPEGAELLDGGVLGLHLLPLVEDCSHLLIIDAVEAGLPPGSLVELEGEQILRYAANDRLSMHQLSFQEVLALAQVRGRLPGQLHLVGVQPEQMELGTQLSPSVAARLPEVLERVEEKLREWGLAIS